MGKITETLDAAQLTIIRQAMGQVDPSITIDEAATRMRRAKRIAQCERLGVKVVAYQTTDLKRIARMLGLE
jgi:hypothetical protein